MTADEVAATAPDTGLQVQRTVLAWQRTGLSVVVNALLVLRHGVHSGNPLTTALGGMLILAAIVTVACGALRRRQLLAPGLPNAAPAAWMGWVVAITWLACVAGAAVIAL